MGSMPVVSIKPLVTTRVPRVAVPRRMVAQQVDDPTVHRRSGRGAVSPASRNVGANGRFDIIRIRLAAEAAQDTDQCREPSPTHAVLLPVLDSRDDGLVDAAASFERPLRPAQPVASIPYERADRVVAELFPRAVRPRLWVPCHATNRSPGRLPGPYLPGTGRQPAAIQTAAGCHRMSAGTVMLTTGIDHAEGPWISEFGISRDRRDGSEQPFTRQSRPRLP